MVLKDFIIEIFYLIHGSMDPGQQIGSQTNPPGGTRRRRAEVLVYIKFKMINTSFLMNKI